MSLNNTVLPIHRHTGKISYMLIRSRQLVKKRRLSAVLIAHQRICQQRSLRQWIFILFRMILSFLAKARMFRCLQPFHAGVVPGSLINRRNLDLIRFCQPECQLISVNLQLHGISHWCQLHYGHFCPGDHSHIQKMLAQCPLSSYRPDHGTLSNLQFL